MTSPQVLLVEDNPVTRRLVQFVLRQDGVALLEATQGQEALSLAAACKPDLILLDIVLPDMSGFDVLASLRQLVGPQTPILAFSGLLASADESRLAMAGFDDVIPKPIEPARLREILRGYLSSTAAVASFGARRRVLLVDDDPVQRKLTAFRLSRLGFEVVGVSDGEEALEQAHRCVPDAVVSDVLMPRMDGFELCVRLRSEERFTTTTIILLTNSYLEEADRALAAKVGADSYVVRTPELDELTAALRHALTQREHPPASLAAQSPDIPREHAARLVRQLSRQMALNASLAQRSAMLSAELAILGGLTSALANHRDLNTALDSALSACFDACGIPWGLLLIREGDRWMPHGIGLHEEQLRHLASTPGGELIARLQLTPELRTPQALSVGDLLGPGASRNVLVAPIVHRDQLLGALVLGTERSVDDHHVAFAGIVAGQVALVLALARTFRELEDATRAKHARVNLLESILNTITDPIIVFDASLQPSHWNKAAHALAEAHLGTPVADWPRRLDFFHPDQSTPYRVEELPVTRALRGEKVDDEEIFAHDSGGGDRWLSVTARAASGVGECDGAVLVVRDITVSKQERARQIANDRMASIGVLAAGVAHEINNPLTALIAELEMGMEDTGPDHPAMAKLNAARDAAERVRVIVRDLRTISRGDSDELGPVDLHRVIDTAVRMAVPQTRFCALVECDLSPLPSIVANEARLVQVLLNLLVNAAQAIGPGAPEHHRIRITTARPSPHEIEVTVRDTGPGMTPEVRARLFTPFFTTKPVGMGTGLGLSICHRIVTSVGGTLDCETEVGRGTTFRLRFPAHGSQRPAVAPAATQGSAPGRRQIFVLMDDPLTLQLIQRALQPYHRVVSTNQIDEGLARLTSGEVFDLVLCNAGAHTSTGASLGELLQRRPPLGSPIAFLGSPTGDTQGSSSAHLPWPFHSRAVRRFVDECLGNHARGERK